MTSSAVPCRHPLDSAPRSRYSRLAATTVVLTVSAAALGCQSRAQEGAALGSLLGAGAGAVIGHQSGETGEGAAVGAAVGAGTGYIIGNEQDKAAQRRYDPNRRY